jgi:hypothetical protein
VVSFLTPPLGDIRSRLIRLIPDAPEGSAENAIHGLLAHRFPSHYSETEAKNEWRDILEGHSSLWDNIPGDRKVGHSVQSADHRKLTTKLMLGSDTKLV